MADKSIQNDFIDGIYEVFSIMFTDGVEDGVYLYMLEEDADKGIYAETRFKTYKKPILLVAKVDVTVEHPEENVEAIKGKAVFTVPRKSLTENDIPVTPEGIRELQKAVIMYDNVYYIVDLVVNGPFVANVYLTYKFNCTEDPSITQLEVKEDSEEDVTEP